MVRNGIIPPLLLLLAACGKKGDDKAAAARKQTIPVAVAATVTGSVPITYAANGTVEPTQTVAIQPQIAGPITEVRFQEGDEVRAGQVLFVIDPRPAQAALAQAQAVLARDRASATAARADAERYQRLVGQGYVTQSQAEQQTAAAQASGATLAADAAAVEAARLNLSYTVIRAPISGKTGNLNVRLGNQVRAPNTVPLVTINAVAPVLVRFPVPDRVLPQVREAMRHGGRALDVVITGAAVAGATEHGTVDFIDNAIDTVSGSVTLKARFANADRRLWPGAFLPLTLTMGETPAAVLVPSVAVQQGPQGPYVFAPDSAGKARQVQIAVDRTMGELTVVAKGLAAGDRVVVDGQSRLYPGAAMKIARTVDARHVQQQVASTDGESTDAAPTTGVSTTGSPTGGPTPSAATSGITNAQAATNAAAGIGGNRSTAPGATTAGGNGSAAPSPATGNN